MSRGRDFIKSEDPKPASTVRAKPSDTPIFTHTVQQITTAFFGLQPNWGKPTFWRSKYSLKCHEQNQEHPEKPMRTKHDSSCF